MEKIIWTIFIIILLILLMFLYKIIKSKGKNIKFIILFIILFIYFLYSFFTIDGSARLSITLYGHPVIAYTTQFKDDFSRNDNNKKYLLPTKEIKELTSFFECKSYGIIKITTYYGF